MTQPTLDFSPEPGDAASTCSFEGCGNPRYAKGYCRTHWTRLWRTGTVELKPREPLTGCAIDGCDESGKIRRGWCPLHYNRWYRYGDPLGKPTALDRFWPKVDQDGPVPECRPDLGSCWLWIPAHGRGYGRFTSGGKMLLAHRFSYTELVGPIPDGLQLDHLCRNPPCVNPAHLEPVTCRVNLLRGDTFQAKNAAKTHCPQGHPYDETNTLVSRGFRYCRACLKAYADRRRDG